ncbi:MAG TPA: COX15/CtaA family protein [Qipengyuania sp.]|nr:COX15/CtaA family protein [Qipengyuania sp.]
MHAPPDPRPISARPVALANWLLFVAAMVVTIVVVGGITRLTESGLSITEWKPVSGALPPLNEADWASEFALYRQSPQFINQTGPAGMDLAAFKFIYFWEWFHRLLGRLIGLAFALPLAWFWWRKAIPAGYKPRLIGLLALGALQGVFGWFMVASGLSGTRTSVSHFWLSIHLMTALLTLAALVWTALDLRRLARIGKAQRARWTWPATAAGAALAIQLTLGAWVAGLDAGHASDSWPLMQGRLVPEFDASRGLFYAATHDPFLIHFLHRWWAWVAVAALIWFARRVRPLERKASVAIHSAFGIQILLGIAVVVMGMPLWLAVAHQLVGALLVAAVAWGAHVLGRTPL